MTHFTAGTRQPYWIEALEIRRIPRATPAPSHRREAEALRIRTNASTNITTRTAARSAEGTPRFVAWAM